MAMTVRYGTVDGQILEQESGGVAHQIVPDTLGNVAMVRDAAGSTVYSATYWPYGEVRTSSGTNPTPWGYVGTLGYYRESATKSYVKARMYDMAKARWTTVDPLWPYQPAYGYADHAPTMMVDPSGRQAKKGEQRKVGKGDDCFAWYTPVFCDIRVGLCLNCLKDKINNAVKAGQSTGLTGGDGTAYNAFIHCYASCTSTRECGCACAKTASWARESGKSDDSKMDIHNDRVGRVLSGEKGSCKDLCLGALQNGDLIVLKP